MIRVYVDDRHCSYEDFDATAATTMPDGSLVLTRHEVRVSLNRNTGQMEQQISNAQLITIFARDSWGRVDNLELIDAQAAEATEA